MVMALDSTVGFNDNMYTRYLSIILAAGIFCGSACAEDCPLTDSQVKNLALKYVREKLRKTSPRNADEKLRVDITVRSNNARTLVVSPLPVTPDASFMLRITCEARIEELDTP
jgi:hypothetical protein